MTKLISILTLFLISSGSVFAQDITIPADSISTLLCKKWEIKYAIVDGMKITRMPGATGINYEFKKDGNFIITSNDPKNKVKGTWKYDPKNKLIKLTQNGQSNTIIISLKEEELIMLADTSKSTPSDPAPMQLVYKPKVQ